MPVLTSLDGLILLLYFIVVVGFGFALKPKMTTSKEFLHAGREMPGWISGLAFLAAGLGAPLVLAMGAMGARFGLQAAQFCLIGSIPAMIFAGLFMMPLYYGSGARSVPGFLGLRFDPKTRLLAACSFAAMTVFSSGISMVLMARTFKAMHLFDGWFRALGLPPQWIFTCSILVPAAIVLALVLLSGLGGAMNTQVVQLLLLFAGFLPVVFLGLRGIGGWSGLKASLPEALLHPWSGGPHPATSPMGIGIVSLAIGVGFVFGPAFWCADFRVLQAAMAARTMQAARRAPLLAAILVLFLPFLLVLPGLVAVALPTPRTTTVIRSENGVIYHNTTLVRPEVEAGRGLVPAKIDPATGKPMLDPGGQPLLDYGMATPNLLLRFLPTGLLGLGIAALLACLISGMAAGATAFNTVVSCDLYPFFARKETSDRHTLAVARWATIGGILLSVLAAFAASDQNSLLGALLLVFSLVNAPLLAILLLGMFCKRATGHGAFSGLLAGAAAALLHHGLSLPIETRPGIHGGWLAVLHHYPNGMARGFWTAILAFAVSFFFAMTVSFCTHARPEQDLVGLVHSLTPKPPEIRRQRWKSPEALAAAILLVAVALSLFFA